MKESCRETWTVRFVPHHCRNKALYDGYCWVHHPDAVAKRRAKSDEQYAQKRAEWDTQRNAAIRARKLAELAERLIPAITGGTRGEWFGVAATDEVQDTLRELYEMRR